MCNIHYFAILLLVVGCRAMYDAGSPVIQLTPDTMSQINKNPDQIWLVEFYAPWCGHCIKLAPEYEKAAKALKGVAKVGAVDVDQYKELGERFQVKGFPTVKIFTGSKRDDYTGPRTAEGLVDAVLKVVKQQVYLRMGMGGAEDKTTGDKDKSDVITLTDSNFKQLVLDSDDMWMVEFYAPWCGHCKNLEPQWARAATELKGKVKVGALDATVHKQMASRYQVKGYPTIKMFRPGPKTSDSVEDYNGGRTSSDIVAWALELLAENMPPPDILQITDPESMNACNEKPLCIISILPHILDCNAVCRNEYLDILKRLGDKFKNKMWGWVWTEASAQPDLEAALEIGGFGYPAMVVVNAKKLKFSTLRGAFSEAGINEFLRDLSFGRGQTAPVRGAQIPAVSTIDPWDGKDGELPTEEDIDLSDVDLGKDEL